MTVIARDAVAADHLVYAWPFPLGPECEVTCNDDEQVVMCPSWIVGDRLGPGRHHWRTPDPMRPVSAFFVLTSPVEAPFDMLTSFMIPMTGQPVRLRAAGSIMVRCTDPGLLIAQFVGLPFDSVNEGILRSVARSVERMLARLLTRRVVLAGTPYAVTDPSMLGQIVDELVAYNPTAGAVFGVELIRMGYLAIGADDGSSPYIPQPVPVSAPPVYASHFGELGSQPDIPLLETARGHVMTPPEGSLVEASPPGNGGGAPDSAVASGEIAPRKSKKNTEPGIAAAPAVTALGTNPSGVAGTMDAAGPGKAGAAKAGPGIEANAGPGIEANAGPGIAAPRSPDETTEPGMKTPLPGAMTMPRPSTPVPEESRGAILGIGMGAIGSGEVSGEIPMKVPPGGRVLVPGPNGLMQSATVRQLLQGYYELEVGSSGQTIWVPINGVVPE
jgi:hypothetical protein